jgi:hypothetical protein
MLVLRPSCQECAVSKDELVKVRLTRALKKAAMERAQADGATSLSQWTRALYQAALNKAPAYTADELDALAALRVQLQGAGNLLNQLVRQIHIHGRDGMPDEQHLAALIEQIGELQTQIAATLYRSIA